MFRKVLIFSLFISLLLLVISPPVIAQDDPQAPQGFRYDAPVYAVHGPYAIGVMPFKMEDATRPLGGYIWYPALNPDNLPESITYDAGIGDLMPAPFNEFPGTALLDAAPAAGGPYPVIFFSPGHGSTPSMTAYVMEHLASYGFIVVSVDHPGDSAREMILVQDDEQNRAFNETSFDNFVRRPQDVTRVLDYLAMLNDSVDYPLAGLIDLERVGVSGLSFGGLTALAVGGARLNVLPLAEWCPQGIYSSGVMQLFCTQQGENIAAFETRLLTLMGATEKDGDYLPSLADSRVDAISAIVPGVIQVFGSGLQFVELPTLLFHAENDEVAIPEYNVLLAWDTIGSDNKTLVTFENANHYFGLNCNDGWGEAMPMVCSDPVWDVARTHDLINHFETAFFLSLLYEDAEAAAALAPDAVQFGGILYETTGY